MVSDATVYSDGVRCRSKFTSCTGEPEKHERRKLLVFPSEGCLFEHATCRIPRFCLLVVALLSLAACEPPYVYRDCLLPTLSTDVPIRTLVNIGAPEDRTSDRCPVPTARTFEARRPYGTIKFEWWGSPHRLYIAAMADDRRALDIRGDDIEAYKNTTGSWLAQYSHVRTFPVENLILSQRPPPEHFVIEIVGKNGQRVDTIQATYKTALCSCAVPE